MSASPNPLLVAIGRDRLQDKTPPAHLRLTARRCARECHHHLCPTIRYCSALFITIYNYASYPARSEETATEPWLSILRTRSAACAIGCTTLSCHREVDRSSLSNRQRAPTWSGEFCRASAGSWGP